MALARPHTRLMAIDASMAAIATRGLLRVGHGRGKFLRL